MRDVEAFDAVVGLLALLGGRQVQGVAPCLCHLDGGRLAHSEALLETAAGIGNDKVQQCAVRAPQGHGDLHLGPAVLRQKLRQGRHPFEFPLHPDQSGHMPLPQIDLWKQTREELGLVVIGRVLPIELATIDYPAIADMKDVGGDQRRLRVDPEYVDVSPLGSRHALALGDLFHGGDQVAQAGSLLELQIFGCPKHPFSQVAHQLVPPPAQERPYVLGGPLIGIVRDQAFHARPPAAVNVVLKAGPRVGSRQVDAARRQLEMPVDKVHQTVGEIAGEVRPEIGRAILLEPARDVNARILLLGQLDVGIGLVVAQQDVVLRLVLLDQVVL